MAARKPTSHAPRPTAKTPAAPSEGTPPPAKRAKAPRAGTSASDSEPVKATRAARKASKAVDPLAPFHPAVQRWFRAALGEPTPAQALSWPAIARGEHTLLLAPTGSGKTLAAFLWSLARLVRLPPDAPPAIRVLYLSPLKALAVDVERNLRAPLSGIVAAASDALAPGDTPALRVPTVAVRTGDTPSLERTRMLRHPPDILITTPESLYLMLSSSQRTALRSVDTVIVDEIHQLVPSKRGSHLFLSLERLLALREGAPLQRIGLSATQRPAREVAELLAGFEFDEGSERSTPRPVTIVDATARRALSITVSWPPPLTAEQQQAAVLAGAQSSEPTGELRSLWPEVHALLRARIHQARSSMIFVNSRRSAERLATALNELEGQELARAHHGSVARDERVQLEERLKRGELPAIVATSSLELGLDMGAVDQVIQVEAPPSVASGIQRIGRASHHVGGVPTGVLVAKHPQDLLACAAAAGGIEEGDVEPTQYLRNALDVLAQHMVSIVAAGPGAERVAKTGEAVPPTPVEALWRLVRCAAPYAALPRESFEGVLDMLAGRYPNDQFAELRPRLTWDRSRGELTPREGARRLAVQNAGTIADRGLYGVFLYQGDEETPPKNERQRPSRRVGELDEEMVFELHEGEVFLLGASSWRAKQITRDRVLVTPAPGTPGKMPFWRGEAGNRSARFGARLGALSRALAESSDEAAHALLRDKHHLDPLAREKLLGYVREQQQASAVVPSDRSLVFEWLRDELGDHRVCLLSPFGNRVHTAWAMAVQVQLRAQLGGEFEAVASDDGIVFRFPAGDAKPKLSQLIPRAAEVDTQVREQLSDSAMYATRFREAAGRALLLPRSAHGKRTPLWAQRKRAADLLAIAQQYPSFPLVLETYRECLADALDLPALRELLAAIEARKVRVIEIERDTPSPMAASLLFHFVGRFVYDQDAPVAERRAHALRIDHSQLQLLLGESEVRQLLDDEVEAEVVHALQRRQHPLRHADAVHELLLALGEQREEELRARAEDPEALTSQWLPELLRTRRVVPLRIAGELRYAAIEDVARYRDGFGVVLPHGLPEAWLGATEGARRSLLARYARHQGRFTDRQVAARFGVPPRALGPSLDELVADGTWIEAPLFAKAEIGARELCDAEVLQRLKRANMRRLRQEIEPVRSAAFARFLLEWQLGPEAPTGALEHDAFDRLLTAIAQLQGAPLLASALEREVLAVRVPGYRSWMLDQLLASGEVVWAGLESVGQDDGRIALYLAEQEPLLARTTEAPLEGALHAQIREALGQRGALFFSDLQRRVGGFPNDLLRGLWDLVWAGEVRADTFEPLRSLLAERPSESRRGLRAVPRRPSRGPRGSEGRWSLRNEPDAILPGATERAAALAQSLLERYGVVLREAPQAEGIVGGFGAVYEVYKVLEEQGRVRRGYFVEERGALQFALPGAEQRLRDAREASAAPRTVVLSATDPANPYGALFPWPRAAHGKTPQRVAGARVVLVDGELLGWIGRGGQSLLSFCEQAEPRLPRAQELLAAALPKAARTGVARAVLSQIDGEPARLHPLAPTLQRHGFTVRGELLVHSASADA